MAATKYNMPRSFKQHINLSNLYSQFEDATKDTHRLEKIGDEHKILVPIEPDTTRSSQLVVSGHQGDEPAGVQGLLQWCKERDVPSHIRIIPVISEESYVNGTHFDDDGQNPNLGLPSHASDELESLIEESERLMEISAGGYLSCQEDPERGMGYLLVWKNGGKHKMISEMLDEIKSRFPVHKNGLVNGDEIEDRTTLGAFCVDLGARMALTVETPVEGFSLPDRVACHMSILDLFVR